ncbi:SIMPL domain-containing protein [Gordonia defluvii]|uniref:SIMPL domain-containing protein n=1 Tax=Gordonia defluvii TaxID=283718 RepID=A0ABP6L5H1_9ACTN|nr:SIMPL domain-containing protein [Gordonia sp. UBA5067]
MVVQTPTVLRVTAVVAALGAAAALLAGCSAGSTPVDQARSVTVVGSGKVTGVPDTLSATIGVETQAADVSAAINDSSATISKITDAAVSAGVDRKDIQTQQVSINPRYSSPGAAGGTSTISGYEATNTVSIKVRDLGKASKVLGDAVTAGGNSTRLSGVSFAIDDDSALMRNARDAAFADARARADQYARLAGDKLGKALVITETNTVDSPGPTLRRAPEAMAAAPVPIEPGQQTLTYSVTVKFALT